MNTNLEKINHKPKKRSWQEQLDYVKKKRTKGEHVNSSLKTKWSTQKERPCFRQDDN